MKFAILTDTLPPTIGGMQTITHELIEECRRHKLEFVVITTKRNRDYSDASNFYPVLNDASDASNFYPVLKLPYGDAGMSKNIIALREIIKQQSIDGILSMDAGFISLARFLDRPFLSMLNGNDWLYPFNAFPWAIDKHENRKAIADSLCLDRVQVVANSLLTRELFCLVYDYSRSVDIVYYGISDALRERVVDGNSFPKRNILTVARLDKNARRKNVYGLIQAMQFLPNAFLTIMGDGDEKDKLQRSIDEGRLSDRVSIVSDAPYMSEKWINVYKNADLFVMVPTEYEGFGLVYLEAQAFGIPVIARNPEVMIEHVTGMTCDTSVDSMATAIRLALHRSWDKRAIKDFSKRYSMSTFLSTLHWKLTNMVRG